MSTRETIRQMLEPGLKLDPGRWGTPAMRARSRILLRKLENPAKGWTSTSLHMFT